MFEILAAKHEFVAIKIMIFWTEVDWLSTPKTMAECYRNQNTNMPQKGQKPDNGILNFLLHKTNYVTATKNWLNIENPGREQKTL